MAQSQHLGGWRWQGRGLDKTWKKVENGQGRGGLHKGGGGGVVRKPLPTISYHDFWYTCVKCFFHFFKMGEKGLNLLHKQAVFSLVHPLLYSIIHRSMHAVDLSYYAYLIIKQKFWKEKIGGYSSCFLQSGMWK